MTIMISPQRWLAPSAAAAVTVAALAITSAGSAQAPPRSLHLVAKEVKGVGFTPNGTPQQGDRFGFGTRISGSDHGFNLELCTVIGNGALCTEQLQLSKGTLDLQGLLPQVPKGTPIAVIGGTGAYNGARGTAIVTKSDFRITLRR